jgi:hypothetical protein
MVEVDGREATTHWGLVDQCRRLYTNRWSAERFVTESGNIVPLRPRLDAPGIGR